MRTPANVLPRQSVSSAISLSMRSDQFIGSLSLEFRGSVSRDNDSNAARAYHTAVTRFSPKMQRAGIPEFNRTHGIRPCPRRSGPPRFSLAMSGTGRAVAASPASGLERRRHRQHLHRRRAGRRSAGRRACRCGRARPAARSPDGRRSSRHRRGRASGNRSGSACRRSRPGRAPPGARAQRDRRREDDVVILEEGLPARVDRGLLRQGAGDVQRRIAQAFLDIGAHFGPTCSGVSRSARHAGEEGDRAQHFEGLVGAAAIGRRLLGPGEKMAEAPILLGEDLADWRSVGAKPKSGVSGDRRRDEVGRLRPAKSAGRRTFAVDRGASGSGASSTSWSRAAGRVGNGARHRPERRERDPAGGRLSLGTSPGDGRKPTMPL